MELSWISGGPGKGRGTVPCARLLESEMFHEWREPKYPEALAARIKQFVDNGWTEVPVNPQPLH